MFAAFAHQEGAVSGHAHQHVFSLNAGQTGVVPPGGSNRIKPQRFSWEEALQARSTYSLLSWALG